MNAQVIIDNKTYYVNEAILVAKAHQDQEKAPEGIKVRCKYMKDGQPVNIEMPYYEAQSIANEMNLPLLSIILPNGLVISEPQDISKMKYERSKKEREQNKAKAKTKTTNHVIQLNSNTAVNDMKIKARKAIELMHKENIRVIIKLQIKGRMIAYPDLNKKTLITFVEQFDKMYQQNPVNGKKLDYSKTELENKEIPKQKSNVEFIISMVNA